MSAPSDVPTFEGWLREMSRNPEAPPEDPGIISPAWRRWLRRLFELEGPVSKEVAARAALAHQVALAEEAVRFVLADIHRTTSLRPLVEVGVWRENSIRISVDGGFTVPSMWEVEPAEAVAEVAGYFQEQLDQSPLGCWPVCERHDVGLHAEVHDGRAVWWCGLGTHAIADIGQLPEAR